MAFRGVQYSIHLRHLAFQVKLGQSTQSNILLLRYSRCNLILSVICLEKKFVLVILCALVECQKYCILVFLDRPIFAQAKPR